MSHILEPDMMAKHIYIYIYIIIIITKRVSFACGILKKEVLPKGLLMTFCVEQGTTMRMHANTHLLAVLM